MKDQCIVLCCDVLLCCRRYEEDAALSSSLGCNGFRLSLEWSRIEPRRGFIDQAAVQR